MDSELICVGLVESRGEAVALATGEATRVIVEEPAGSKLGESEAVNETAFISELTKVKVFDW
jgi:hypothetical protein